MTLDLTGLPPTLEEVDAFLADSSHEAYEKVVDRLLESPRYGEHMARFWLDAARYGDTHGLHLDNYREIWPYRDWVIRAFNANKPFDRFIVEQLAGDLLPDPTPDQIIATGYNRCHVSTNEGGSIEEEVYVRNIVDQVDTNGTVFLGLTTGCARCHDHKYDPIRAKDYYQLFAFFNNIDGPAMDGNSSKWEPIVQVPSRQAGARRCGSTDAQIAQLKKSIAAEVAKAWSAVRRQGRRCRERGRPAGRLCLDRRCAARWGQPQGDGPWEFVGKPDHPVYSGSWHCAITAQGLKQRFFDNAGRKLRVGTDDTLFAYVYIDPARTLPRTDAPVAYQRRLDAPRILGRKPDRLGQGRHARAAQAGRPAGCEKVGAAGGAGGQAQARRRHGHRRLGVHPARRHDLLGQSRHRNRDSAGRAGF